MNKTPPVRPHVLALVLTILVILNLALLARLLMPVLSISVNDNPIAAVLLSSGTPIPAPEEAGAASAEVPAVFPTTQPGAQDIDGLRKQGIIVLSIQDGLFSHLFAYHPLFLPLTRITTSNWDDIDPSVSPDGTRIAFSSHANGFWDLYLLDLKSGEIIQLTNTPDYDGKPTWSPDGEWLCYESYRNNNFDLFMLSAADPSQAPIQLTDDPAADYSPSWSAQGRQIAFVSTRSGEAEIWLADLDKTANRFTNISQESRTPQTEPAWSPDGRFLSWTSIQNGISQIETWDSLNTVSIQS
jgi:TolB protein